MSLKEEKAQPVELKMSPADMAELRGHVAAIAQGDVQLGRALQLIVLHLSHAHGLDPAVEDAKAKALAEEAVKLEAKAAEEATAAEGEANAS
jgi:hypothetical protein